MKGYNELRICQDQMVVIVQEWVDRNLVTKPIVVKVTLDRERPSSLVDSFVLDLHAKEPAEKGEG
jgi:hypothetical protein